MARNQLKTGFHVLFLPSNDASKNWNEVLFLDLVTLVRGDELGKGHGDGDWNCLSWWIFADDVASGDDEAADVARLP